jgi:hypothetical protein
MMPTKVPMMPERMMVFQYWKISFKRGTTRSLTGATCGMAWRFMVERISARPKAPTMAGMRSMPPLSAGMPKVKRGKAWRLSTPMVATRRPRMPAM